jgi:3-dehydroquinate dehydratase/shikimate dehydrogenase
LIATLETKRLILRPWRETDREPFARLNADPAVMEYFPSCLLRVESDQLADRIEKRLQELGWGLYAAELRRDGNFIGFIGLSVPGFVAHFTPCVEIGWRLATEYWGQGLATEGARVAMRYGFETLALDEIVSFTVPGNLPSRRVIGEARHDARSRR